MVRNDPSIGIRIIKSSSPIWADEDQPENSICAKCGKHLRDNYIDGEAIIYRSPNFPDEPGFIPLCKEHVNELREIELEFVNRLEKGRIYSIGERDIILQEYIPNYFNPEE